MRRTGGLFLGAVLLLAMPAGVVAAPKSGCPAYASGWFLSSPTAAAADFFEHLIPGQFATADEFAEVIAGVDKNGDDAICVKLGWGYNLNTNAHWYRLGFDLGLGEPVHLMTVLDNNANAS